MFIFHQQFLNRYLFNQQRFFDNNEARFRQECATDDVNYRFSTMDEWI